eukprot:5017010-Prymnesium_polylepis.1
MTDMFRFRPNGFIASAPRGASELTSVPKLPPTSVEYALPAKQNHTHKTHAGRAGPGRARTADGTHHRLPSLALAVPQSRAPAGCCSTGRRLRWSRCRAAGSTGWSTAHD